MRRLALLALALTTLSACATIGGVGRDMQSAGRAIERESYQARN